MKLKIKKLETKHSAISFIIRVSTALRTKCAINTIELSRQLRRATFILFILIFILTILITQIIISIKDPNIIIKGYELHHFYYGLIVLIIINLIMLFIYLITLIINLYYYLFILYHYLFIQYH